MLKCLGTLALVGATHVAAGVFLYYARVRGFGPAFASDTTVFYAPAVVAFGGYFFVIWRATSAAWPTYARVPLAAALAFVAVVISFNVMAFVAFNRWGT